MQRAFEEVQQTSRKILQFKQMIHWLDLVENWKCQFWKFGIGMVSIGKGLVCIGLLQWKFGTDLVWF